MAAGLAAIVCFMSPGTQLSGAAPLFFFCESYFGVEHCCSGCCVHVPCPLFDLLQRTILLAAWLGTLQAGSIALSCWPSHAWSCTTYTKAAFVGGSGRKVVLPEPRPSLGAIWSTCGFEMFEGQATFKRILRQFRS